MRSLAWFSVYFLEVSCHHGEVGVFRKTLGVDVREGNGSNLV